jgi:maleate cis-trans isomerase
VTDAAPRAVLSVPANNTTMEPELNALRPELAPFAVARVRLPAGALTRDDIPEYTRNTLAAIEPFMAARPTLVVQGCTAAGFLAGRAENAKVVAAMRRRSGATVVSTGEAMVEVLAHEGVDETAVATPYLDAVNEGLRAYLADSGIAVETLASLRCETVGELGRVTAAQVRDLALRTVTRRSRALFIACSQLPTLEILASLRRELGIPVWSSVSATAWAAERALASATRGVA